MPFAFHRARVVLVAVVTAAAVVSCTGDDDPAESEASTPVTAPGATTTEGSSVSTVPASSTAESTAPVDTEGTSVAPTLAPATLPPSTTAPAEPDNGDCLIGDWVVTDTEINEYYAGLMATVDAPIAITASGQATLTFDAAGSYRWAPDFDLVVDIVGAPGTGATSGTATGSWSAAAGTITTASDQVELLVSITVNETTFSGSDLADGLLAQSPVSGATYSCAGGSPVIDFRTADPEVFVPVELSPA